MNQDMSERDTTRGISMRPTLLGLAAAVTLAALLAPAAPARAQLAFLKRNQNLDKVNGRLCGRVLDYTENHGADRRIVSPILGQPRDLYVYLPPGYNPAKAYPLIFYFHTAYVDENVFIAANLLSRLDGMMARGEFPPAVVVCPDGLIDDTRPSTGPHSLFINGVSGRFEDHVLQEVLPFVMTNFSIRPEREAHAILGLSGGGFGAMSLALRHRDLFATVATLAGPLNLRYDNCQGNYFANFDPATYRESVTYDPNRVVGRFYLGLRKTRAAKYIAPVFGEGPEVVGRIAAVNPADQLAATNLAPGELSIYVNYPGKDNFNFDAQAQSFAWLAAQRGVSVTLDPAPHAGHTVPYFKANHTPAYRWLATHLLPPIDRVAVAAP